MVPSDAAGEKARSLKRRGLTRRGFLAAGSAAAISLLFRSRGLVPAATTSPSTGPAASAPRFSFLHTYESTGRYWQGIEKAGLVRKTTGVRLINSPWGEDAHRFNQVARLDGPLHQILRERQCQFVVDRVVGGSTYLDYPFDQSLIRAYEKLLGDRFLGGQIHEPVCNTGNDWDRFRKADARFAREPIDPERLKEFFNGKNANFWLEYGTLEDYRGRTAPADARALWAETQRLYRHHAGRFGNRVCACEGLYWGELGWHVFYGLGATSCLAEIGAASASLSQFGIAALRGAARAAGKPWGVFFAPWGPKGCTSFLPDDQWSWHCPKTEFEASDWPIGPHLGPSSALQRRLFFHAYLSGAHTLHEEWGAECNLLNYDGAGLSSYGRVTRDLLDFQEHHPDVGQPYTPLALVLDAAARPPGGTSWPQLRRALGAFGPADNACAALADAAGQAEAKCLAPYAVPEVFDIVPSDAPEHCWAKYDRILSIDAAHAPPSAESVPQQDLVATVLTAARDLSPFDRMSHLAMQINRRSTDGAWIVALFNPWGAHRGDVDNTGSVLDQACTQRDILRPKFALRNANAIHAWPGGTGVEKREDGLHVTVGPGGTLVIEIHPDA